MAIKKTENMATLTFDIHIAATAKKTWQVLWFDEHCKMIYNVHLFI